MSSNNFTLWAVKVYFYHKKRVIKSLLQLKKIRQNTVICSMVIYEVNGKYNGYVNGGKEL